MPSTILPTKPRTRVNLLKAVESTSRGHFEQMVVSDPLHRVGSQIHSSVFETGAARKRPTHVFEGQWERYREHGNMYQVFVSNSVLSVALQSEYGLPSLLWERKRWLEEGLRSQSRVVLQRIPVYLAFYLSAHMTWSNTEKSRKIDICGFETALLCPPLLLIISPRFHSSRLQSSKLCTAAGTFESKENRSPCCEHDIYMQ